ncbi:hypothetical protein ACFX13_013746 [Malus domestica]
MRRRRKKKSESKSLTDLQFEELKGFMDLGFVFSEEDKDSNLVSIIAKFKVDEMAKANEFIRKQRQRDWEAARLSLIEVEKNMWYTSFKNIYAINFVMFPNCNVAQ